jgi:hypothetical protein
MGLGAQEFTSSRVVAATAPANLAAFISKTWFQQGLGVWPYLSRHDSLTRSEHNKNISKHHTPADQPGARHTFGISSKAARRRWGVETAVDQAIAACGGEHRATIRVLVIANDFLERQVENLRKQIEELKKAVSRAFVRGRFDTYTG